MKLLRGSELQFIVASLMSPDVQKDVGALFVCGCPLARQLGCSVHPKKNRVAMGKLICKKRKAKQMGKIRKKYTE